MGVPENHQQDETHREGGKPRMAFMRPFDVCGTSSATTNRVTAS